MLGETVSFVLGTPRKSTSSGSDACVVLSGLPTVPESQNLMTCPRWLRMKTFALPILWLTFLEYDTYLDAVMFLILNSWYFSLGFFFTLKATFGGIGGASICNPLNAPLSSFPSQT